MIVSRFTKGQFRFHYIFLLDFSLTGLQSSYRKGQRILFHSKFIVLFEPFSLYFLRSHRTSCDSLVMTTPLEVHRSSLSSGEKIPSSSGSNVS